MIFEELQDRYGPYVAERVREGLTLDAFETIDMEELIAHLEYAAERAYEEYRKRQDEAKPESAPADSKADYLSVLERRWQDAEELAHLVLEAEVNLREDEIAGGMAG